MQNYKTIDPGQCFPFYTYDEDGSHRRENITDWALGEFRAKVKPNSPSYGAKRNRRGLGGGSPRRTTTGETTPQPPPVSLRSQEGELTKWDIFYYVYGLLHHPEYRTKYAANLRRELPRIPISPDFWAISEAGKKLADLHVKYEEAQEYPLEEQWAAGSGLNFLVEKMKLKKPSNDVIARSDEGATKQSVESKRNSKGLLRHPSGVPRNDGNTGMASIIYNKDLALTGIPPEAFDYRLGNRSAIDWIIDQYQISTDKRSGIVNDPNREDDEQYIIRLIKKVVTVSLETVRVVGEIEKSSLGS